MHVVLTLLILAVLFTAAYAGVSAAPWLPTKGRDRQHLLEALELKAGQAVVDLGCGDGSLLFGLARKFPQVTGVGYEISLLPYLIGQLRRLFFFRRYRNVHIKFGNLFQQSLQDFDMIFVFLLPKSYPRLIERFKTDLKDDSIIIVEAWPLPNIEPSKTLKKEKCLSLYFYTGKQIRGVD